MNANIIKRITVLSVGIVVMASCSLFAQTTFKNPILTGMNPDPSICRVGDDFYLVTSTFEYYPGLPVYHSKDLVNWKQIGHALTTPESNPLKGATASWGGQYAPTLRYHDGMFYIIGTNYGGEGSRGISYVSAKDPAGPWSDPIWIGEWYVDPSLEFIDDTVYYLSPDNAGSFLLGTIDLKTGKFIEPLRKVADGLGGSAPEGPHFYKVNDYYYIMSAEGGTGYEHREVIQRSKSPWGPYEPSPDNPVLSNMNVPQHPFHAIGHADFVQLKDGTWWAVCLGIRPRNGRYQHLGRETFLAPITWSADGWPKVGVDGVVREEFPRPNLPEHRWEKDPVRDDFDSDKLNLYWQFIRNPYAEDWSLTEKPGSLRLNGSELNFSQNDSPAFIGRRQTAFDITASAKVNFTPASDNEEAGLVVRADDKNHYDLLITRRNGKRVVMLRKYLKDTEAEVSYSEIPDGDIILRITATDSEYKFLAQAEGEEAQLIGTATTKDVSNEVIGGFTGVFIGMYASGNGKQNTNPADFDWFDLEEAQEIEFGNTIRVKASDTNETVIEKAAHVVPTANQLAALDREFIAFIHFGPNTFTRREWGNGMEDPGVFDLKKLDTDQWCEAMKAAGMKMVVLTAKHHDGFVLWQSRYTSHGVMSTGFREGKGDIMKDLSASCRKYGLKLGVYLSPADLYQIEHPDGLYGNLSAYTERTIPREVPGRPFADQTKFRFVVDDYNEYFLNQLFELLTEYGPIHEVWFDGAHPKTKGGQKYNYAAWRELIRSLAPEATIFGREDIRWCGNEAGYTRDTEWNVIAAYTEDPRTMSEYMDLHGDLGSRDVLLGREKPYYLHYQPAETNTSIREGWFYRDETHQRTRSADDVFDIYERSVGGNSIFLLNIPPTRKGIFSPVDVAVLKETGRRIGETYGHDLFEGATMDRDAGGIVISVPKQITLNRIAIREDIATSGERVEKHAVDAWTDGQWMEIAQAANIGHKRILRFPEVTTDKIRIRIISSRLTPAISRISAHYYRTPSAEMDAKGSETISARSSDFDWSNWNNTSGGIDLAPDNVVNVGDGKAALVIDLGRAEKLTGFAYIPLQRAAKKTIVEGVFQTSTDGKRWKDAGGFSFGNLVNDPTKRYHYFKKPVKTRYIRIVPGRSVSNGRIEEIDELDIF